MEAWLYDTLDDQQVRCRLCSHQCLIGKDKRGICGVRENRGGVLQTLVYGRLIAAGDDPIEKKPIFHLLPGSRSFSIATVGCNFKCRFCQNADIAQMPSDRGGQIAGDPATPQAVVTAARERGCKSISYTYTEPTVFFEFACDTAELAHAQGMKNIFVTNGYMSDDAIERVSPWLDAANVDLKAFSDDFYKKQCGARLEPVKATLRRMKEHGIWVEVTTLIIPGLNDDPEELSRLAAFIAADLGTETPWHVSRFHPTYRLTDREATPVATLLRARDIGIAAGLKYVYTGNIPGRGGEDTLCPGCQQTVIARQGFRILDNHLEAGRCLGCGTPIDGIGMQPA
ncbi:AmmeMemoRadiSam system radical SAM enzyme [Desulfosarcina ovata subsp. sediminis]|uniref:AmmeMemoRadiSam system radical SAM enzyme n=1 Tax=Desulfosarcina ovata subsp. sediminis TaxID=885957 RepID=A0A5K7ZU25_9BACT|nr:AmmeMemoRadiSam system radical SAM enzyme [Desulfosarcina ovata]BBO83726.1 AmmeMemoRadiSam system radical SAM enzyme [Desulfosarcina ovata subsp. sediminis]